MDCVERPVNVLVLSDAPDVFCQALLGVGVNARGFSKMRELLECLPAMVCAGLILDIPCVMKAPSAERDRLFKLAEALPILRARREKSSGRVEFLDDIDHFVHNCKAVCPTRLRAAKRYATRLNVQISREDDPAMTKAVPANILNISKYGCYVYTLDSFAVSEFVFLKIFEFEDSTPIFGLIRWRKPWGERHVLPGMGVVFLDILDQQIQEIEKGGHFIPDLLAGRCESSPD